MLRSIIKPKLEPGRAERVYLQFAQQYGYESYHDLCRSHCTRRPALQGPQALSELGFQYVEVMEAAVAEDLLARARTSAEVSYLKKDTRHLEGYRIHDDELRGAFLGAALNPEVDALALDYFGSEYLVHWFTLSRTPPAAQQASVSFRWHCDKGPRDHLKLIVYLNASADHGGSTAFLNLNDTHELDKKGYIFGPSRKRTDELAELSRLIGHQVHEDVRQFKVGEGVLFQPARVLHRGVSPDRGPRFALTLCLLPSPIHWAEAFRRGVISDLAREEKWPAHASELFELLDPQRQANRSEQGD